VAQGWELDASRGLSSQKLPASWQGLVWGATVSFAARAHARACALWLVSGPVSHLTLASSRTCRGTCHRTSSRDRLAIAIGACGQRSEAAPLHAQNMVILHDLCNFSVHAERCVFVSSLASSRPWLVHRHKLGPTNMHVQHSRCDPDALRSSRYLYKWRSNEQTCCLFASFVRTGLDLGNNRSGLSRVHTDNRPH